MRNAQKQKILTLIESLHLIHEEIKKAMEQGNLILAQDMISAAQESAISLGENIEKTEGEGHITVSCIEEYCELLFRVFEDVNTDKVNANKAHKVLRKQLIKIENSVKNDIAVRLEIAFFPYKASMWDSLESIYLAAKADSDCDTYCVPIPYYTLKPNHGFDQMHYEGGEYPKDIEITDWREYDFENRRPDAVFIHNPYDDCNFVTSVHPRFYSSNLKKYTDLLIYVPYYSTSGVMSEAQSLCPAYIYADYIVIQSPGLRAYFDANIPDDKFLPLGSPKFDKIINKCQNPSELPVEWKERMAGRKVYFYNTSLSGMLADTEAFLKKMNCVFECFEGREDACLLWRPHPLLEDTFDSMRPQYRHIYDALKRMFLDKRLGILDTTPDITDSIAWSDVYIGDAGTSVTALFGVAGKPVFILNNSIMENTEESEWWKYINIGFNPLKQNKFAVIQGNMLYVSEPDKYDYSLFCYLTEGECKDQYFMVYEMAGRLYVCPSNAQNILAIGKSGVEEKIELEKEVARGSMFSGSYKYENYLFLIPLNYSSVVRYDTATGTVSYFTENVDVFVKEINGEKIRGCAWIFHGSLYIMSPTDNMVYRLDIRSGKSSIIELPIQSRCGGDALLEYNDELWILPRDGRVIVCWNPETNEAREYAGFPDGFICKNPISNAICDECPFSMPVAYGKYLYLPSWYSNMSLKLDMETGMFEHWIPAFESEDEDFVLKDRCAFLDDQTGKDTGDFKIYSFSRRKLYSINLEKNICQEIRIQFDHIYELANNEAGGYEGNQYLPYACVENHFNTLDRLLQDRTIGNLFDREKQINAYRKINASHEGNCGEKVYGFIKNDLQK
mgnify:CR=1 FL=1